MPNETETESKPLPPLYSIRASDGRPIKRVWDHQPTERELLIALVSEVAAATNCLQGLDDGCTVAAILEVAGDIRDGLKELLAAVQDLRRDVNDVTEAIGGIHDFLETKARKVATIDCGTFPATPA